MRYRASVSDESDIQPLESVRRHRRVGRPAFRNVRLAVESRRVTRLRAVGPTASGLQVVEMLVIGISWAIGCTARSITDGFGYDVHTYPGVSRSGFSHTRAAARQRSVRVEAQKRLGRLNLQAVAGCTPHAVTRVGCRKAGCSFRAR
jgi:hypothetical protein